MGTLIHSTAVVYPHVELGENVVIGPHCVVGTAAFIFPRAPGGQPLTQIQLGGVQIGDNTELIGHVSIARAAAADNHTWIGADCRLDHHVHVAHDCKVGTGNLLVSGTQLGGFVTILNNNFFGIGCCVRNRVNVGSYNLVGMGSIVVSDIGDRGVWTGNPARQIRVNQLFD